MLQPPLQVQPPTDSTLPSNGSHVAELGSEGRQGESFRKNIGNDEHIQATPTFRTDMRNTEKRDKESESVSDTNSEAKEWSPAKFTGR